MGNMDDIVKIGVFGGSFDPPHEGHLAMARKAIEIFHLDRVLFVPCYQNPLKDFSGHASPFHRYVMTQLATLVEPNFLVTPIEVNKKGKSYTIDTLKDIKKTGFELYLLMGMDAFLTIGKWKDAFEIPKLSKIAVFTRNEKVEESDVPAEIASQSIMISGFEMSVSSTEIRKKVRDGEPINRDVAPTVEIYIKKYDLYRHFRDQNRLIEDPIKDYFIKGI